MATFVPVPKKAKITELNDYRTHFCHHEVQDPIAQGGVENQGLKLNDELGGHYGVEW